MLKAAKYLCALFLAVLPLTALADGNELLEQCQDAEHFLDTKQVRNAYFIGICFGLVQGVRNTMQYLDAVREKDARVICLPPKGIENGQAVRIVVKYLRNNPDKLHEDAVLLAMLSFKAAYPCG